MAGKTIGFLGCGNIGRDVAVYAGSRLSDRVGNILLYDKDRRKALSLQKEVDDSETAGCLEDLVRRSDLVVEAAAPSAVGGVLSACVEENTDAVIISVGGILGNETLLDKARRSGIRVMLPSGAVCGIDGIKAASVAGIEKVSITTRKGTRSVKGAPYLREKGIDLDSISGETEIFRGSAAEAIRAFPKNINVAVMLSLAGTGPDKTQVRILVSPRFRRNSHEVRAEGPFGAITTVCENIPSPSNPKTSYLASLSCISVLRQYFDTVRMGG
jgi:aspartate dehydrogenase